MDSVEIATDKGNVKLDEKAIGNLASKGAEFVQILAKLSGEDLNKYATSKFGDVTVDRWYAGAVAWAAANGIVSGIAKDEFAPNAAISRQDMAVIIERYLKN